MFGTRPDPSFDNQLNKAVILEFGRRRGIDVAGLPPGLSAAVEWVARRVADEGVKLSCRECGSCSRSHLICSTCSRATCQKCVQGGINTAWNLGWQCPECYVLDVMIDGDISGVLSVRESGLLKLATEVTRISSKQLAAGTWALYQRAVVSIISFSRETGIWFFPVISDNDAKGLCLYLAHLANTGKTFSYVKTLRSAVASFHRHAGVDDPFTKWPRLSALLDGLRKSTSGPVHRAEGLTIVILRDLVGFLLHEWQDVSRTRRIRACALRDAVCLVLAFFAMRRASEMFVDATGVYGLRIRDITYRPDGPGYALFVRKMKNDVSGSGHSIMVAMDTESGFPVGHMLTALLSSLKADGVTDGNAPLFIPTTSAGWFSWVPSSIKGAHLTQVVRSTMRKVYVDVASSVVLASMFSFHSLRRGGAEHALYKDIPLHLVQQQGAWGSLQGLQPYVGSSMDDRVSVSRRM